MIKENILAVRERIRLACAQINQDPAQINIIAVSKARVKEEIKEAIDAGITDIGENRVQEAITKYQELSTIDYRPSTIKWHMVGHLQTNKAKEAVRIFDLIHSVDSLRLAAAIDKEAGRINKVQDVLVQVNTSGEPTKFGLKPTEVSEVIKKIAGFKNINIKGLMTIAPIVDNPEKARPSFRLLRELKDKVNEFLLTTNYSLLTTLSMGMTDDFEIAIKEGSNMVRIGRAIFAG